MTYKPASAELLKKISNVQEKLNVPKNNYNEFGGFSFRSCEDILEKVKPILREEGLTLTINDQVQLVGERYYIQATIMVSDGESIHRTTGFAREAEDKKKMDPSQLTGAASSYARKYALNGMFAIDDNKDADTPTPDQGDNGKKPTKKQPNKSNKKPTKKPQHKKPIDELRDAYRADEEVAIKLDQVIESEGNLAQLPVARQMALVEKVNKMLEKKNKSI
ncbi:MAG: ERF family protein [Halanaerobiales bacterium]